MEQYNMNGNYNVESRDAMLYKHKYLKYKAKYLQLERMKYGGNFASFKSGLKSMVSKAQDTFADILLDHAVILTKKELILDSTEISNLKTSEPLEIKRHCLDLQGKLVNKSHILKIKDTEFQKFSMLSPLCGKSKVEATTQKAIDIGKSQVEAVTKKAIEIGKPLASQLQTQLKDSINVLGKQVTTQMEKMTEEGIRKGSTKISGTLDNVTKNISKKLQGGGDIHQGVNEIIKLEWPQKSAVNNIQKIVDENGYDIVIRYRPSKEISTLFVTKLDIPEKPTKPEPVKVVQPKPTSPTETPLTLTKPSLP